MEHVTPLIVSLGTLVLILSIIFIVIKQTTPGDPEPYNQKPCDCELGRDLCYSHVWVTALPDGLRVHRNMQQTLKCPKEQKKLENIEKSFQKIKERNK